MKFHSLPLFFAALVAGSSILASPCLALSNVKPLSATSTATLSAETTTITKKALADFDYATNDRIPWMQEGYDSWTWRDHKINYIEMGDSCKPAVLLIHGFGASAYHWRYNIPVLARDYHVYAIDLLGFGLSDKPLVGYSADVWRDQAADFIREVIQKPTTVAGNSLGGFTALYTSTVQDLQPLIDGCVLLNGAGRFRDPNAPAVDETKTPNFLTEALKNAFQRLIIGASFIYTKQPARIEQVLQQVYPVNPHVVDAELVDSIQFPSQDPNAAEVFFRVITKNGSGPVQVYVDDLLASLQNYNTPLLLCWGEQDPWIRPAAADKIQALYPAAIRDSINAGHCPHDEAYTEVNASIKAFVDSIQKAKQ